MNTKISKKAKGQVIEMLALKKLTVLQQNKILKGLQNLILDKVNIAILEKLSEEEKKEFEKSLKSKNKTTRFLNSKIGNIKELIKKKTEEVLLDFRRNA